MNGPVPDRSETSSARESALRRWLRRVVKWPLEPIPVSDPAGGWAYRVANYQLLRAAGVTCVIAPPSAAAGVSCHVVLEAVDPAALCEADVILVEAGQFVPADGTVIEGGATIDESAVTGQSTTVVRSYMDEAAVLRDTRVVAGQILVKVAKRRGHPLDWINGHGSIVAAQVEAGSVRG
jgi:hypothetical protein